MQEEGAGGGGGGGKVGQLWSLCRAANAWLLIKESARTKRGALRDGTQWTGTKQMGVGWMDRSDGATDSETTISSRKCARAWRFEGPNAG